MQAERYFDTPRQQADPGVFFRASRQRLPAASGRRASTAEIAPALFLILQASSLANILHQGDCTNRRRLLYIKKLTLHSRTGNKRQVMKSTLPRTRRVAIASQPLPAFILGLCLAAQGALAQTLPLSGNLIDFKSPEGEQLLVESTARRDFWPLSEHFVTQDNGAYCGVASSVMVLNALGVPAPESPQYGSFRMFTQQNLFAEQARKVLAPEVVARKGMTLAQLGQLLESYPVRAEVRHAADSSLEEFRALAVKNLQEPENFVLVNYLRNAIGQEAGGHISPIAAYNEKTDRFLILDVSRYKYPPVWVSAADLWKAMDTLDADGGKTRGFVLVSPR